MGITVGDVLFVDTNVLLTATDEARPRHHFARRLLGGAGRAGVHLVLSGQILREYLVVATRSPDVNGLGLDPDDALSNVEYFRRRAVLHDEPESVADRLQDLVRSRRLSGKRIHDANVVATMMVHGTSKLVTDNGADFAGFAEIEAITVVDAVGSLAES